MNVRSIALDINKKHVVCEPITIAQGDRNGTTIAATIYDGGTLVTTSGLSAKFRMRLPDGRHFYEKTATWDAASGTATVTIDETQAASAVGTTHDAYFELISGTTVIHSTSRFLVRVLRSATEGMSAPESYSGEVEQLLDALRDAIDDIGDMMTVRPEDFGAITGDPDGLTDEERAARGQTNRTAIQNALSSGKPVSFTAGKTYYIHNTGITVSDADNVRLHGNHATILGKYVDKMRVKDTNTTTYLGFVRCNDVTVRDLTVCTDYETTITSEMVLSRVTTENGLLEKEITAAYVQDDSKIKTWHKVHYMGYHYGGYGISFIQCKNVSMSGCDVYGVGDGVNANGCVGVWICDNAVHHMGEEAISVRQSKQVVIRGNDCYMHRGDCILVKAFESADPYGIVISENRIHDAMMFEDEGVAWGGGITINAEFQVESPVTQGVVIANNTIDGARYGVQLCNVANVVIANNYANVALKGGTIWDDVAKKHTWRGTFDSGSCAFGLALQPAWSPQNPKPMTNVLFTGNVGIGGQITFLCHHDSTDVPVDGVIFDGNVALRSQREWNGEIVDSNFCCNLRSSIVTNNKFTGGKRIAELWECDVRNNYFGQPIDVPISANKADIYMRQDPDAHVISSTTVDGVTTYELEHIPTSVFSGNVVEGHMVYFAPHETLVVSDNVFTLDEPDRPLKLRNLNGSATRIYEKQYADIIFADNVLNGRDVRTTDCYVNGNAGLVQLYAHTMSPTTIGGAKLGDGLALTDGALGIDPEPQESTGEVRGSIASLTAKGWATQDSTPTPESPVPIQVARGRNLIGAEHMINYVLLGDSTNGYGLTGSVGGTSYKVAIAKNAGYVIKDYTETPGNRFRIMLFTDEPIPGGTKQTEAKEVVFNNNISPREYAFNSESYEWLVFTMSSSAILTNTKVQLELGSTPTPYVPYGHVGINIAHDGTTTTIPVPLPSKGYAASLPNDIADVLTIDGAGKVEWESAVARIESYAGESVGATYLSTTGELTTGAEVYYPLATPTTEDFGYIDWPSIPDGATVTCPELDALGVRYLIGNGVSEMARDWYERARSEYEGRISALEQAVAELATA